jgi:8-oxo-dGTP pyrophosphatase MutT (NUDIX family)
MDNSTIRGVIFLITNKENRFLLEQRDENSKLSKWSWAFPGGVKDAGEETLQTVIREAREEFGINLNPNECEKIGTSITHSGRGMNEIWHCHLKDASKPLVISESAGAGWFTLEEIKKMDLGYKQSELVLPVLNERF